MENVKLFFNNKEIEFSPVKNFALTYEKTIEWVDAVVEIGGILCNIRIDKDDIERLKAAKITLDFKKQIAQEFKTAKENGQEPVYKITEING